jgi:hypothetical protein
MIDPGHGLVKLARAINGDRMDEVFRETFSPDQGRPGISTRLMVSLYDLKYTHNLSDDEYSVAATSMTPEATLGAFPNYHNPVEIVSMIISGARLQIPRGPIGDTPAIGTNVIR